MESTRTDLDILKEIFDMFESYQIVNSCEFVIHKGKVNDRFRKLNPNLPEFGKYYLAYSLRETPASKFTDVSSSSLEVSFKLIE